MEQGRDKVKAMLESGRCRGNVKGVVESTECGGRVTEDGSIGVKTWLQIMCCTLAEEQGVLDSGGDKHGRHKGIVLSGERWVRD